MVATVEKVGLSPNGANGHARENWSPIRTFIEPKVVTEERLPTDEEIAADNRGNLKEPPTVEFTLTFIPGANSKVLPPFTQIGLDGKRHPVTGEELQDRLDDYMRQVNDMGGVPFALVPVPTLITSRTLVAADDTTTMQFVLGVNMPKPPRE